MTNLPQWLRIIIEVELGVIALGVLVGILGCLVIILQKVLNRSALVSPQAFKDERTKAEANKHTFELDCAWPWYFRRQLFADLARIKTERETLLNGKLWKWLGKKLFTKRTGAIASPLWLVVPYPLVVLPFLICVDVAAFVCNLLFIAVAYAILAVAWITYGVVVGAMRVAEYAWLRFRGTSASCPKCFFVSKRPAYKCAGCGALHRDIRPGRLGVFERRCKCGEIMHTTVLRAAWSEQAVCQRCAEPLREGAAAVRDVRLPIFGDVAAGKTRFLYASLDSISALAEEHALPISYPDPESRDRADTALATIRSSQETAKTDVAPTRALSFRFRTGSNATLIHLYDAAGELYRSTDRYEDVSFLDSGHGLIYVIDPFALSAISSRVARDPAAAQRLADGEGKDPELAYNLVVGQLRDGGVKAKTQRLAVVVSKVDALETFGIEFPTESTEIADWLHENGLHNLVLAAPNEFSEVRYFAVASIPAAESERGTDAGAPLRWLLRSRGVPLPDEPEPPTPALEQLAESEAR